MPRAPVRGTGWRFARVLWHSDEAYALHVKKLTNSQKAARTVQPRVESTQRRATVTKATRKTVARSAVTGRYVAKPRGTAGSAKTAEASGASTQTRSAAARTRGRGATTSSAVSGGYVKRASAKRSK